MLKSNNTFEPDTFLLEDPMIMTFKQWKQSHLFNLCMIWTFTYLYQLIFFLAFGIVRKWGNAKEWLRHWIPLIYFSSFFVCFYYSPPATLHFKYNTNELPGLNILFSTFCSSLYLDIRIFHCIQNYSPIAFVQSLSAYSFTLYWWFKTFKKGYFFSSYLWP